MVIETICPCCSGLGKLTVNIVVGDQYGSYQTTEDQNCHLCAGSGKLSPDKVLKLLKQLLEIPEVADATQNSQ